MRRIDLRKQLLISIVLLIIIPLLCIMVFSNSYFQRSFDEQVTENSKQMLDQVRINTDESVGSVEDIIKYLANDENVLAFLRLENSYDSNRIAAETGARRRMHTYESAHPSLISGLLIAGENELYASNDLYRVTRFPLNNETWYQNAVEGNGKYVLIPRPIGRNIRNFRNYSADDIVTVARAVYDPDDGKLLGVICVDMLTTVIEQRIREITLGKSGYVFVVDEMDDIVYAPVNDTVYRIRPGLIKSGLGSQQIGKSHYQLLSSQSGLTGWTVIGVFETGTTLPEVSSLQRYTLIIAFVAVALAVLLARVFSASFTRPITELRELMHRAESGDLDQRFASERYAGEIKELGNGYNIMISKLKDLIALVYREQQDKREAEIRTLQAQIKPHFLYNTLDTIRWMAEEHQAKEIVQLVGALTRLFRISLSGGKEIIALSEEVEHVRNYLYIQKVRYEDKLNYSIDVPEELGSLYVNKLILQPLVENAIYHGIKQKRGSGHIVLKAFREADNLVISVSDDGAGMTQEKCDELNRELRGDPQRSHAHGYGIYNVNDRIRLSQGRSFGLFYSINADGGITAALKYPICETYLSEDKENRENG